MISDTEEEQLAIEDVQWNINGESLTFYTNNPIDIGDLNRMPVARRLLSSSSSYSNSNSYSVELVLSQQFFSKLLPDSSSSINKPITLDFHLSEP